MVYWILHSRQNRPCFEETDENGYTTMESIPFDYRVSNLCNFKCPMCGEQLFQLGKQKNGNTGIVVREPKFMVPENKKIIEKFKKEVVEEEFWMPM